MDRINVWFVRASLVYLLVGTFLGLLIAVQPSLVVQLRIAHVHFGRPAPLLVFTGGDSLRRPDVFDLVAAGTGRGLRVALTPSGTAAARREKIFRLKASGLARLAVSLDASTAQFTTPSAGSGDPTTGRCESWTTRARGSSPSRSTRR